jgi:hypothetical protein
VNVGLSFDGDKQDFGCVLGRGSKIQMPPLLYRSEAIFLPHEESLVLADQDFTDMSFPDITPAGFFLYGPEKVFNGDEPAGVRDEPELIRPVSQKIGQKTA